MSSRCALRCEDREVLQTRWQVFDPGRGEGADAKCNAKVFIPPQSTANAVEAMTLSRSTGLL